MPKTVTLEDGTTMEVPTQEELDASKKAIEDAKALQEQITALKAEKEAADNDPVNKNWREIREKTKKLEDALKASGKEIGADGNIIEKPTTLTKEEIERTSIQAATGVILNQHKNSLFGKYGNNEDKKKVVEHYFNKLSSGEELDIEKVNKFFSEAERLANPGTQINSDVTFNGAPPRSSIGDGRGTSFADTDAGKSIANEIFGPASYAQEKK